MAKTFSMKWAKYYFNGKYAFLLTLQHPRLRYAREFQFWAQLFKGRSALNPGLNLTSFLFLLFKSIFSDIHRASNHQLVDKKKLNWIYFISFHIWIQPWALNSPALVFTLVGEYYWRLNLSLASTCFSYSLILPKQKFRIRGPGLPYFHLLS